MFWRALKMRYCAQFWRRHSCVPHANISSVFTERIDYNDSNKNVSRVSWEKALRQVLFNTHLEEWWQRFCPPSEEKKPNQSVMETNRLFLSHCKSCQIMRVLDSALSLLFPICGCMIHSRLRGFLPQSKGRFERHWYAVCSHLSQYLMLCSTANI